MKEINPIEALRASGLKVIVIDEYTDFAGWDRFDNTQALNEGWDLFDVDNRLQLQRIDCPSDHGDILDYKEPKFASDTDALIATALKAHAGSQYHRSALELIGTLVEV